MFKSVALGAIFIGVFIFVHCDNASNYNEITRIYVPSAPQNLTANRVTSEEIHLSWAPPLTSSPRILPNTDISVIPKHKEREDTQADEPMNDVIDNLDPPLGDEPIALKDFDYNLYKNEKLTYEEPYRSKREIRSLRHRKRRQNNSTEPKTSAEFGTDQVLVKPIEVVKKSFTPVVPLKDPTQIAYVLYYEQGVPRSDTSTIIGVQSSADVKRKNVFPSDLGMEQYSRATKNLTLLNTSGVVTKVVGFRLKNLKPFTPYKIWVRAFYNFSLDGVKSFELVGRLGPSAVPVYVLTDVKAPSAPVVLNLTCDQPQGLLYVQWRQPLDYNNSLDQYVVTLRKIPEQQPRTRLTLPTNKNDIETTIMVNVDLSNVTRYEVKLYAVTLSVVKPNVLVNGSESPPEEVSSEWCLAHSLAMSPGEAPPAHSAGSVLALLLPLLVLAAAAAGILYWRCRTRVGKCLSAAYNYLEEGGGSAARAPLNAYKKPVVNCLPLVPSDTADREPEAVSSGGKPPRMSGANLPVVKAVEFPKHVAKLHADGDIGFSKEYEIVVAKSAALGHTSHHSNRPENRLKNRYLNITAYDHSRVCVSRGGRCGAVGCVGAGRGGACDYVNANFIDGMLPSLSANDKRRIRRKLERRERPHRQPSIKPTKPPPNLAEGIESAFLNIEFSGIVEDDNSDSDCSDDDSELDDVYVDLDGIQTRVKLEWLVWRRRYIATQGPTPATLDAFWRMIWQHRVHTVVMITNLVERGRRKCDMYWPDGGRGSSVTYGSVRVTLLAEDVRAAYTVRRLQATATNTDKESDANCQSESQSRTVVQYHYTVWPDHGTPRHPLAVLPFVKDAAVDSGTVLVHCSAGVGRTGTYIVLDAQLNQLKLTGTLSPLGFLCRARTQRNHLVQTEEQYVFVHDALLEHVRSGDTEIDFYKAREYLAKLLEPISDEELAVLDLNPPKTVNEINGITTNEVTEETTSVKSAKSESENVMNGIENGSQSQLSIKTDELNSDSKSSRDMDDGESKEGLVNGGEETEGVYDLAPRATDTYSKKMAHYNSLSEQEKEEIRKINRMENYALLERMRSLANRHHSYQGPPPVNLLEKQYLLITRSCVEPSICARAAHNVEKNRLGGVLPTDSARVMLVPKPGVEGSEYINASWVCGWRRQREYAVTQHPPAAAAGDVWRLMWDHCAQLVLLLHASDDPECESFWPTEDDKELFIANFKASYVSKETYIAYRKRDRKSPSTTPSEPETNGLKRQDSDVKRQSSDLKRQDSDLKRQDSDLKRQDSDERLIPEQSPVKEDCKLSAGQRDLSARKSIANGDLFSSLQEKKGPKSPKSPSKMSLKNLKLSSPTKFKFPEWGCKTVPPPDCAPPPPPLAPAMSVEEQAEIRRPCYYFERVEEVPESIPQDRIIQVTNVSVHSLQDDYQLSVKIIQCNGWLEGDTAEYAAGKPDANALIRELRSASNDFERCSAIDRLIAPYRDSLALTEFVAGCQMEYKNGPVVVVDKYGGAKALSFCTLSAATGALRENGTPTGSLYTSRALAAHARAPTHQQPHSLTELLKQYCALAHLKDLLPTDDR